jgi:hypothetical protein
MFYVNFFEKKFTILFKLFSIKLLSTFSSGLKLEDWDWDLIFNMHLINKKFFIFVFQLKAFHRILKFFFIFQKNFVNNLNQEGKAQHS